MNKGLIVSGFPAVGKSYLKDNLKDYYVLDSDSSNFSWIKDAEGNNTKQRNPDFPKNYIRHIKKVIKEADIVLISSHIDVRKALVDADIDFLVAYPHIDVKNEWIDRLKARGSSENFIKLISENWDEWIKEIEFFVSIHQLEYIELGKEEYLYDNLNYLLFHKDFYKYKKKVAKNVKNIVELLSDSTAVNIDNKQEVIDITYELIREYADSKIGYFGG